ncbi:hypothetical protein ACWFRB_04825 [Rhodococcus sp. NPDC055112]
MSRNLARRAASVLAVAALLGGGLALGTGAASAEEASGNMNGSVETTGCNPKQGADCDFPLPFGSGSTSGSVETFGGPLDWAAVGVLAVGQAGGSIGDLTFGCNPKQGADCDFPTPSEILLALLQGRDPHTL